MTNRPSKETASPLSVIGRLTRVDWSEHAESRQATKLDLIDIAQSLGIAVVKGETVAQIRAQIRTRIAEMVKAKESLPRESYTEPVKSGC